MLEAAFRVHHRKGNLCVTKPHVFIKGRFVQTRCLRTGRRSDKTRRHQIGQPFAPGPVGLRARRNDQAVPRPEHGAEVEGVGTLFQRNAIARIAGERGERRRNGTERLVERTVAFQMRVEVSAGHQEPVAHLFFNAERIRRLNMIVILLVLRDHVRAQIAAIDPGRGQFVPFGAKIVFQRISSDLVAEVELEDVRVLVQSFVSRINRPCRQGGWVIRDLSPLERGFVALFELIFITERQLRPVRQGQAQIEPGLAVVQIQITIQTRRRLIERRVVTPQVVEILPIGVVAAAHKAQVRLAQAQGNPVIFLVEQGAPLDGEGAVPADGLAHFKPLVAGGEPLLLPPILPKLSLVAINSNPANRRRNREDCLACLDRPFGPLIDPGPQETDLRGCQRIALSRRRHLFVFHQPRHVMDQFALGALAGNNVILVILAPLERRLAIIEPEMAFRAFGSMAAEARIL